MIRNHNGFAMALILALLPVALALFIAVFSVIGFLQVDLGTKYPCREEGLSTQRKVSVLLEKLLQLNPRAKKLKTDLEIAENALQVAIEVNPPMIWPATLRVNAVKAQRAVLDHQQKHLIQQSNLNLSRGHRQTRTQLQKVLSTDQKRLRLFQLSSKLNHSSAPQLAVRPDYPDVAPTYSPSINFEKAQSLAHSWQYQVAMARPFSHFLTGSFKFEKSCSVTLKKENSKWIANINKDKFLSKSLW